MTCVLVMRTFVVKTGVGKSSVYLPDLLLNDIAGFHAVPSQVSTEPPVRTCESPGHIP